MWSPTLFVLTEKILHLAVPDRSPATLSQQSRLAERWQSGVTQFRIPVGSAPLWREIEQIPLWVDRIDVARVLPRLGRRIGQFGAPEVADHFALAPEHVEHRPLGALCVLAEVVAVVGVTSRG